MVSSWTYSRSLAYCIFGAAWLSLVVSSELSVPAWMTEMSESAEFRTLMLRRVAGLNEDTVAIVCDLELIYSHCGMLPRLWLVFL